MQPGDTKGDTNSALFVSAIAHPATVRAHKTSYGFRSRSRPVTLPRPLFIQCLRFLFAEFLEAPIVPQRIEHWIEPEQGGSVRRKLSEKFSLYCFGASEATICSKLGSPRSGSQSGCRRSQP